MVEALVVGSVNLDTVYSVDHAPHSGETVLGEQATGHGGKGGNQASLLAQLKVSTGLVANLGDDPCGQELAEGLASTGIQMKHVRRMPHTTSGRGCVWVTASGNKHIVVAPGANGTLSPRDVTAAKDTLASSSIALLQLEIPSDAAYCFARLANEVGTPLIVNLAPVSDDCDRLLEYADTVILNRRELELLTGRPVDSIRAIGVASAEVRSKGVETIIVTLGADGVIAFGNGEEIIVSPTPSSRVDSTGSGDAFCAAFAAGIVRGLDLHAATEVGSYAGSACSEERGARLSTEASLRVLSQLMTVSA